MEGKNFIKLCKDTKLMNKSLTSTDIDLIFTKVSRTASTRVTLKSALAGHCIRCQTTCWQLPARSLCCCQQARHLQAVQAEKAFLQA
jgi:hypothetical protein